ncbi:hypothetical protein ElyMa_004340100 [Elysia marginata]|uniref:DUF6451 domain-containing protein n=1 Tax=Elysia marginata TaxID=1093978 RepID=A0AAV4H1L5_9GAST|nr:hypothetical protein ElyMa_004340100 [Elysia marginata]
MQSKTEALPITSKSLGLRIHSGKSKVLRSGEKFEEAIILGTEALEEVVSFTYLGRIIDLKGGTDADIKPRIRKVRSTYTQLQRIWKAGNISQKIKIKPCDSNVKSVFLYGCETWKATPGAIKKVQTFILNRYMRGILRIKWHDRVRNEEVWRRTEQKPVEEEIRWCWIGHTQRKPHNNVTRQALQWNPQGNRGRGRVRETWKRCVEREMTMMGKGWSQLGKLAQDRSGWHLLVRGLYPAKREGQGR